MFTLQWRDTNEHEGRGKDVKGVWGGGMKIANGLGTMHVIVHFKDWKMHGCAYENISQLYASLPLYLLPQMWVCRLLYVFATLWELIF